MHSIIQFVGALVAIAGVVVITFAVMMMVGGQPGGAVAGVSFAAGGLGTLLSGALLYCFGAIVEHLIAIRRNGEEQLRIAANRSPQ
jgi:hypothetical protein